MEEIQECEQKKKEKITTVLLAILKVIQVHR